ncbi:MAG: M56 family metallopeptidase [Verrucomicrobiota bacterium]
MDSASLLTAIFRQVLHNTLWASALGTLLALAWRWLPGWSRYGLGLLVLCRLLMPALPVSPLSAANWWREAPDQSPSHSPGETKVELPAHAFIVESVESAAPADVLAPSSPRWTMERGAASVWLAGAAFLGIRLFRRQRAFNRWWKARRAPASALWQASLADCRAAMPGRRRMQLWQIQGLGSPLACGIFRPCILVPTGLNRVLEPAERAHILRHELAHHRHFDLLWNLLFAAATCLHWFNPLAHTGLTRLLREREIQRDADAVRACPGSEAAGYGATLLKLVTLLPHRMAPAPVSSAMLGNHHLKQRLTMIPRHTQTTKPAARITFTAAAALLAVLTFTKAQETAPVPDPAPVPVPASGEQKPEPSGVQRKAQTMMYKLNNIVIPRLKFENATIDEVIAYLRAEAIKADNLETDPEKKGINIILKGESKMPLNLDLRQLRLLDALKAVCEIAGYRYRLEPNTVVLMRLDLEDRSLLTRVFRINEDVAKAMGWQAGKDTPLSEILTSRYGIQFPEGSAASLDLNAERLTVRLPLGELDNLETFLEQAWRIKPIAAFELTSQGLRKSGGEDEAKFLTETEFTDFLKTAFKKNPATVIRLRCKAGVEYSKVSTTLDKVQAAGFKNVDLQTRAEEH